MSIAFIIVVLYQAYCFYHIYKNRDKAYWYIIILLFPFIGGLIYFLRRMMTDPQARTIGTEITPSQVAIPSSEIDELEERVELADTVTNKIMLADAYVRKKNFSKAIEIYESCFNQFTEDDEELNEKLLTAYYLSNDFVNTIALGKKLESHSFFKNSKEKTYYAWAFFELNDDEMAEQIFEEMNVANTNFYHRLEYAKFLIETDRKEEANEIILELLSEAKEMDAFEKKNIREVLKEVKLVKERILD